MVADTVIQQVDNEQLLWRLKGTRRRQTLEIQTLSYFLVTVNDAYVLELDEAAEPLVPFVASFDQEPIVEVVAMVGSKEVGSWLGYGDGHQLHRPATRRGHRIEQRGGYRRVIRPLDPSPFL